MSYVLLRMPALYYLLKFNTCRKMNKKLLITQSMIKKCFSSIFLRSLQMSHVLLLVVKCPGLKGEIPHHRDSKRCQMGGYMLRGGGGGEGIRVDVIL
jgi:hypothetical protein